MPRGIDPGFQYNVGKLRGYANPGNAGVPPIIPPSRARDLGAPVKAHRDPAQSYTEAAANRIYHELGLRAPDSFLVQQAEGLGVANVTLPHGGPLDPGIAKNVLRGFVADVWLGNRMAPDLDNIRQIDGGETIRINQAGSLLFHADGRRKTPAERNDIGEWYDFANPKLHPGYAGVFEAAGLSLPEELGLDAVRQIAAIRQLRSRSHDFEDLAPPVPGLPARERRLVLDMLRRRHDLLERKVPGIYLTLEPSVADAALRHEMGGFFEDALNTARNALERGVNLHGMSDAELVRLHLYTLRKGVPDQWTYEKLNEKLRSSDPATRARVNVSRVVLNNALAKLPDHQGTVYRGLSFTVQQHLEDFLARHKVGEVVSYSAFTSADIAEAYAGQVIERIQSRRGKRIADYSGTPGDDEVLFRTDSRFRVLDLEPPEGDRPLTIRLREED